MTNAILRGKPDAENPHIRFDEGEVAAAKPRRGSLLYGHKFVRNRGTGGTRLFFRSCVLGLGVMADVCGGYSALAATTTVASPERAIVSYASESKAVVNVRGLSSARDNATRMRLKGCGAVLIIR